jgi:uncharacterized protein YneF (UPF0154 family)
MTGMIITGVVALIAGLVGGFFIGVYYLRKQLENMQSNPQMIQEMAKKMGYNLNKQQMNKAQQMMKNQNIGGKKNR